MRSMSVAVLQPTASGRGSLAIPSALSHGVILGVDPGLRRTGYAIIRVASVNDRGRLIEAGVVRLDAGQPIEQRLVELERGLDELMSLHQPGLVACEQLYAHYKHPRTAILMGHARGVILALAARRGLRIT